MKTERRTTKQRTAILELLMSTTSHPTATWLFDHLKGDNPGLSLGTVYRNLAVLADERRILVLSTPSGTDRFDADTREHYHVQCDHCGRVDDVPFSPDVNTDEIGIGTRINDADAARTTGYCITGHRLDFFGICPDCLAGGSGSNGSV